MSLLLSPYSYHEIELKNRVVMPPMCMYKALEDGCITDFHRVHYAARAIGGVGLIITEATAVEARGRISDNDLGLWCDEQIIGHQQLVALCHQFGAKMGVQLAHAGRKSLCKASTPVAPSALLFSETNGYKLPQALTLDDIKSVKNHFVQAAFRAAKAGYDMLELHAAHGYLLYEFLSPLTNQRNDMYGGSLENRCALVIEICHAIIQTTGLPLIVRLSADEWVDKGWNIHDSIYLSDALHKIGVRMMHLSAGGNHEKQPLMPPLLPCYQADYAQIIKQEVGIPTIAVGLITSPQTANELLERGVCDLVAFGRELLRNPNLVQFAAKEANERALLEVSYARAF